MYSYSCSNYPLGHYRPGCYTPGYFPLGFLPATGCISRDRARLSDAIRLLWEQHVVWTRLTIISMAFDLPDVTLVTNRLLRNPQDFAAALKPFYGDKIAAGFAELLTSHLLIAAELVQAAKAGNTTAAAEAEKRWYANADDIAAFLGRINSFWSERQWREMLHMHLDLTKSEAVHILTGQFAEGIAVFDAIEKQALEMADVMTEGIVRQFNV